MIHKLTKEFMTKKNVAHTILLCKCTFKWFIINMSFQIISSLEFDLPLMRHIVASLSFSIKHVSLLIIKNWFAICFHSIWSLLVITSYIVSFKNIAIVVSTLIFSCSINPCFVALMGIRSVALGLMNLHLLSLMKTFSIQNFHELYLNCHHNFSAYDIGSNCDILANWNS